MGARREEKKHLSMKGFLQDIKDFFDTVQVTREKKSKRGAQEVFKLTDHLMSGLAIFSLKIPSLLDFDNKSRTESITRYNLKTLFDIEQAPSDTRMRETLDKIDPQNLRGGFRQIFSSIQRGKCLEQYEFLNECYLLSVDGTGYFSSPDVCCDNCCKKNHQNGTVTFYHQMLSGVIVHPDRREVIPVCPEPILKQDGATKNDCERNATNRFLQNFRREHPHLKVIFLSDALGSTGPNIKQLCELKMSFIIGVKPDGNKALFEWVDGLPVDEIQCYEIHENGITHRFRFVNKAPLNDTHYELEVNFIEYWQLDKNNNITHHFSWVTDIFLTQENVFKIMQAGRSRWKIENETFNTLKNQGYHFEHNYGHGKLYLSTVLAYLMMLAFAIDQAVQMSCGLFQAALRAAKKKSWFWRKIQELFACFLVDSWTDIYSAIIYGPKGVKLAHESP